MQDVRYRDSWFFGHPGFRRAAMAVAAGIVFGLLAYLSLIPTSGDDSAIPTCWGLLGYTVTCESAPSWHAGAAVGLMTAAVAWLWLWARQDRAGEQIALDERHTWRCGLTTPTDNPAFSSSLQPPWPTAAGASTAHQRRQSRASPNVHVSRSQPCHGEGGRGEANVTKRGARESRFA